MTPSATRSVPSASMANASWSAPGLERDNVRPSPPSRQSASRPTAAPSAWFSATTNAAVLLYAKLPPSKAVAPYPPGQPGSPASTSLMVMVSDEGLPAVSPSGRVPSDTVNRSSSVSVSIAVPTYHTLNFRPPPIRLGCAPSCTSPGSVSIPVTFTGMVISSQALTGAGAERLMMTSSEEPSSTVLSADSETYTDFVAVPEPGSAPGSAVALSSIVISTEDGLPIVSQVSRPN